MYVIITHANDSIFTGNEAKFTRVHVCTSISYSSVPSAYTCVHVYMCICVHVHVVVLNLCPL